MNRQELRDLADRVCSLPLHDILFFLMNVSYGVSKLKTPDFVTKHMQDMTTLMQKLDYELSKIPEKKP